MIYGILRILFSRISRYLNFINAIFSFLGIVTLHFYAFCDEVYSVLVCIALINITTPTRAAQQSSCVAFFYMFTRNNWLYLSLAKCEVFLCFTPFSLKDVPKQHVLSVFLSPSLSPYISMLHRETREKLCSFIPLLLEVIFIYHNKFFIWYFYYF